MCTVQCVHTCTHIHLLTVRQNQACRMAIASLRNATSNFPSIRTFGLFCEAWWCKWFAHREGMNFTLLMSLHSPAKVTWELHENRMSTFQSVLKYVSIASQSMTQLQSRCRSSQGLFDHLEFPDRFQFLSNYCRALRIWPKQNGWWHRSSHTCPFKTIPTCGSCSLIHSWTLRVALTLDEARWAGHLESWWLMWSSTTLAIFGWNQSSQAQLTSQPTQTAP